MPSMTPPVVEFGPAVPAYNAPQVISVAPQVIAPGPVVVPVADRDVAWDNIVDVVDDYFKVAREDRVRLVGDVLTEGQIETYPLTGATLLEPWRGDSVGFYERLESTFQSMRRRALVRVMPEASGYLVDVTVLKELEDVVRPQHATAGAATFRYDTTIDRGTEAEPVLSRQVGDAPRPVANPTQTVGWIGMGRDPVLEQVMLARIQERLTRGPIIAHPAPPPVVAPQAVPIFGPPPAATDVGLPPSNVR
jgi:hypothetical protein